MANKITLPVKNVQKRHDDENNNVEEVLLIAKQDIRVVMFLKIIDPFN